LPIKPGFLYEKAVQRFEYNIKNKSPEKVIQVWKYGIYNNRSQDNDN